MQQVRNIQKLSLKGIASVLACVISFATSMSIAAIPDSSDLNAGICTDCKASDAAVMPNAIGGTGIIGIARMLSVMAPAAIFLDKNGKNPVRPLTSNDNIHGVGAVIAIFHETKKIENGEKPENEPRQASGFLINECLVVTNKHVITLQGYNLARVGFLTGSNYEHTSYGEVVASGNYNPQDQMTNHEDWAIIKLVTSVGHETGFQKPMFLTDDEIINNQHLSVAGIIEEKAWSLKDKPSVKIHKDCFSTKFDESGFVKTNCSSMPGTSGSELVMKDADGNNRAVGIMKNGLKNEILPWDKNHPNGFLPFTKNSKMPHSLTEDVLNQIITENPCN